VIAKANDYHSKTADLKKKFFSPLEIFGVAIRWSCRPGKRILRGEPILLD
jgi:hypothetical protein